MIFMNSGDEDKRRDYDDSQVAISIATSTMNSQQ